MVPFLVGVLLLLPKTPALAGDPCKLGSDALARRELAQAEGYLKQCLKARPAVLAPYLELCALYQMQDNADALYQVALQGLRRFPEEKRFYSTVGNRAGRQGRFDEAIQVFSKGFRR
ncbi:MAG TPA: hypothetical protein VGX03_15110, partial [Candidatus Binatia bacterium]|nr:hypothetical protein [Candidatus Binatia bacterium]